MKLQLFIDDKEIELAPLFTEFFADFIDKREKRRKRESKAKEKS